LEAPARCTGFLGDQALIQASAAAEDAFEDIGYKVVVRDPRRVEHNVYAGLGVVCKPKAVFADRRRFARDHFLLRGRRGMAPKYLFMFATADDGIDVATRTMTALSGGVEP